MGSVKMLLVIFFSGIVGVVSLGEAYQIHGQQNGGTLLTENDSTDPILAIPDSVVWDATGSGSGNEGDNEAKTASVVELKIDNGNNPPIEATTDKPRIETGRSVEVVEVKDDGDKPYIEAEANQSEKKQEGDKLQNEANVASPNAAIKSLLKNNNNINDVAVVSQNGAKSVSDKTEEISNKREENLPDDGPKSLAELLKDDDDANQPMPKFETISEELKWKFNKARNDLKKAKQIVQLAEHIAKKKHKGTSEEQAVKDIITKTEVAMVHAGEKMGLDYMHYRRRRSIDEDEFD